jgi:hypothetical protein
MERSARKWQLVTGFTVALLGVAAVGSSQFISYTDRTRSLLEGNWQSCREADGRYAERVYENTIPGIGAFELHLGPYHEFALFRGIQDEHRDHTSSENLLHPYNVEVESNRGLLKWEVAGLHLDVALGGGSKDDCESWFINLRRLPPPSSN